MYFVLINIGMFCGLDYRKDPPTVKCALVDWSYTDSQMLCIVHELYFHRKSFPRMRVINLLRDVTLLWLQIILSGRFFST